MQSFLQYRRVGRQVEQQLEAKKNARSFTNEDKDVEAQTSRRNNGHSGMSSATRVASDNDLRDEEKTRRSDADSPTDSAGEQAGQTDGGLNQEEERPSQDEREELERVPTAQAGAISPPTAHSHPQSNNARPNPQTRQSSTLRTFGTRMGTALTGVNVRDRDTNEGGGEEQVFVVNWEGDDDGLNPHNWSSTKRWGVTVMVALIGAVVGIASSIDSSALMRASEEFNVSQVVESMATGLYLVGFGCGALFAGPISETLGRNPVYISTLALYMIFIMASGLAPNIGAQLAFRFLAGFFGSTPLTCAGGSVSDIWNPLERVYAFPIFANAAFTGPILGPVMGGFIVGSYLDWRWTEWITLIISGLVLVLIVLFQPETYAGVLLSWRASHLRRLTGDDRYSAPSEVKQESFISRLRHALYRPFLLTFSEPIVMLIALYLTVIYIILFTFLDGYTYIFADIHGTNDGITGLCFLGIIVGLCLATTLVPLIYHWAKRDLDKLRKKFEEEGKDPAEAKNPPEDRLWFAMMGGSIAIPVSLFWMGWTSDSNISIWSPLAASVLFGYGILCVFISSYQYIIDSYEAYSASALASVTLIRYLTAGGMVVVGIPMYENLGVHYTLTVLGCIAAVMAPIPYLFYKYGPKIRKRSKYAVAFNT